MIARADGSALYNLAVAVDDLDAGDHARRPRRGPPLQHAQAAARARGARRRAAASTRTCRCCTGRTARSSPSATAPPRCRSCATPATCPRRCATTSRCSAGATDDDETILSHRRARRALRRRRASRSNPARFDEQKLRWLNGRYMRELALDELTARARGASPAARGLRAAVEIIAREDPDARRLLAAVRASSSTGRPTTRRRARSGSATTGRDALARRARRAGGVDPFDVDGIEAALQRASSSARGVQAGRGLPAGPRRARRHDRVAGDLRDASRCSAATRRCARIDAALDRLSADLADRWRNARRACVRACR